MKLPTPLRLACVLALPALVGTAAEKPARKPLDLPTFVVTGRQVTELPPFVVTGMAWGPNWRYASIPGYEIITQCSDAESREIVEAIWRGRQLVLPPEFWPDFSVPMTVVLFNQPPVSSGQPTSFGSARGAGELAPHWTNLIKRTLEDREGFALNLWPSSFNYSPTFRFHLRTLFHRRAPAVPVWLNEGLFGGYGVYVEGVYWSPGDKETRVHVGRWHSAEELRQVQGFPAISKFSSTELKEAERWRRTAAARLAEPTRPLRPSVLEAFVPELSSIFERPPPAADDPALPRWASAAGLFAHWGIYGRKPGESAQFWRFADRASREPVTEQLFRECFGQSYADVRAELSWYIVVALSTETSAPITLSSPPKIKFRNATNAEVSRVRGEWERMESTALAADFPELAENARKQAAGTLGRAYNKGDRDPRLLASLGLLAMDAGDYKTAHEHLEAAVAGHVTGPRVYLETARLRWAASRLDDEGTLAPEALAGVIDLLMTAEQQGPPLASVYLLLANATMQARLVTPAQADALRRGLAFFPRLPDLHERIHAALDPALR